MVRKRANASLKPIEKGVAAAQALGKNAFY